MRKLKVVRDEGLESIAAFLERYVEWMKIVNFSPMTIEGKRHTLKWFTSWCEERGVTLVTEVTPELLDHYQAHLHNHRSPTGKMFAPRSQAHMLQNVRSFFRWLRRKRFLSINPASEMELPRLPDRLPRDILTIEETEKVLAQVNLKGPMGLRDRAMLETLYSTGIRRLELVRLQLQDIDMERGLVTIREGKGRKDRIIPIGERALLWIKKYVDELRPRLALPPDTGFLFLTKKGKPVHHSRATQLGAKCVRDSGVEKQGACHIFRHTMATLMLENDADIRYIQQMLGHKHLNTTDIYTRVSVKKLKEIHTAKHPGAKLKRTGRKASK